MSKGDFPESLSQAILVGIMLVGRSGVYATTPSSSRQALEAVLEECPHVLPFEDAVVITIVYYY